MKHQVVIGAGYGDEGKGRMIDYFVNQTPNRKLVVRFNSGAQAGHNVVLADGKSHIHSHISSGSFSNHDTYLSKYFVCNPMAFLNEWDTISTFFTVYVDSQAMVTTPFDVYINQELERKRGANRHGSVGIGFGETIERYEKYGAIPFFEQTRELKKYYLTRMREAWFFPRCMHLGLNIAEEILDDSVITNFLDTFESFENKVHIIELPKLVGKYEQILFEGAQGLMLDMDYGAFPHVTRSNTGLKNAVEIMNTLDLSQRDFDVCYVTRSYVTRHGAGPLKNEDPSLKDQLDTSKETNVLGEFQGNFRYAPLDVEILTNAINQDLKKYNPNTVSLAITCLDQWKEPAPSYYGWRRYIQIDGCYKCYGPNREATDWLPVI